MAAAWFDERPRQLSGLPTPTAMNSAAKSCSSSRVARASSSTTGETIKALREKLNEFQAENSLLGTLVKELKVERDGLQKKLAATAKQNSDASSRAATALHQVDAAGRDQKRMAAEVERLTSVVHSQSLRLQKAKAHQKELEDVALDMRAELDEARAKQEAAEQAAGAAAQRVAAAEAKLAAAGMGPMPKMGPTAEQLVINSTQRIRELSEELASLRSEGEQKLADAQQQVRGVEEQWRTRLEAAQASAQEAQQQLERRLQQQSWELEQQSKRAEESEQQCRSLQQQVLQLQQSLREAQLVSEACAELERSRQALSTSNQALQQQVAQLQQQQLEQQSSQAASLAELQHSTAALQREKQQLSASLAAIRQAETGHRLSSTEAASKVERLRGELLRCVGELQAQLAASAVAGQQQQHAQQQLRALEATAAAARQEVAETRQQLAELASVTLTELREQVAGESVAITGLPDDVGEQVAAPVANYIKVLEHAVCDCERRSKQLLDDALTAQQYERDARQALASAREAQASAERALQQQTQRLLAAERMRLSDLKEQQSLDKRLALAQQECARLRDALLNRTIISSSTWQQEFGLDALAGTAPAAAVGPAAGAGAGAVGASAVLGAGANSPTKWALGLSQERAASPRGGRAGSGGSPVAAALGAGGAGWGVQQQPAATPMAGTLPVPGGLGSPSLPTRPQQQQQQRQQEQGMLWQLPAADAGQAGTDAAADSAATINRYQAKLAQLRAMKEQLMRRTCVDAAAAAAAAGGANPAPPHTATEKQHTQPAAAAGVPSLAPQLQQESLPTAPRSLPPTSALVWSPRSVQEDWLIGAGSAGGVNSSGRSSMDHSAGGFSDSPVSSYGLGAGAHSSSGGASHLSGWSFAGRAAAGGSGSAGGLGGSKLGASGPSRLGASAQRDAAAAAAPAPAPAGTRLHTGPVPGGNAGQQQQQQQGEQGDLGAVSSMKEWVKAARGAAGSSDGGSGDAAAGLSRRTSSRPEGGDSLGQLKLQLPSSGVAGLAPSSQGMLSSGSNLQRWAQPQARGQQQAGFERQPSRGSAGASRRSTLSARSSQA